MKPSLKSYQASSWLRRRNLKKFFDFENASNVFRPQQDGEIWKRQLFLSGFKNFLVLTLSDSLRICYFPLWVRIHKSPDSPDARGRRPYPGRKSCGFKNIPIRVDGAEMQSRHFLIRPFYIDFYKTLLLAEEDWKLNVTFLCIAVLRGDIARLRRCTAIVTVRVENTEKHLQSYNTM